MIRLTERDIDILRFINQFGFCEMAHINRRFHLKKPRNYQVIKRLIKEDYIKHESLYHKQWGVYILSQKGASYTGLPPGKKPRNCVPDHHDLLIHLSICLKEKFPEASWVSERELHRDKYKEHGRKKTHVADGMLVFPCGKKIPIELELTSKNYDRNMEIFRFHRKNTDVKEVWYFCNDDIFPIIKDRAKDTPIIKVHSLKEWLNAKS